MNANFLPYTGDIDRDNYLGNKALVQQLIAKAENAGGIVAIGLERPDLRTGIIIIRKQCN